MTAYRSICKITIANVLIMLFMILAMSVAAHAETADKDKEDLYVDQATRSEHNDTEDLYMHLETEAENGSPEDLYVDMVEGDEADQIPEECYADQETEPVYVDPADLFIGNNDRGKWEYEEDQKTYTLSIGGGTAVLSLADENNPVLTLTSLHYNGGGYQIDEYRIARIYYKGETPLTIKLKGNIDFEIKEWFTKIYGIYSEKAGLIFDGKGSLKCKVTVVDNNSCGYGVYANGDITVKNPGLMDLTVDFKDGVTPTFMSYGLQCTGSFSTKSTELNIINKGKGYGICSSGDITKKSGKLTVQGGNYGIGCDNATVSITGGTLEAKCDGAGGSSSYGVFCKDFNVSGGNVVASAEWQGGTENVVCYGIHSTGQVNISGGNLTASGESAAISGKVINTVYGDGWSDTAGTKDYSLINKSSEGRDLVFLKTVFPSSDPTAPVEVSIPEGGEFTYDGSEKTGVASGEGYSLSGTISATDAGDYEAVATLADGYIWSDWSSEAKTIKWKIKKAVKKITVPKAETGLVFNGKKQTGVKGGSGYTLSGTAGAVNAGIYTASATLITDANYDFIWSDGTSGVKTIKWKIDKAVKKIAVPKAEKGLIYNKKTQTGVKGGSGYTLSGTVKTKNAGKYKATAKLKTDTNYTFKWSDGSTGNKTISWSIGKAENTFSIKPKTATVEYSKLKKKDQKLDVSNVINFKNKGQGSKTYTKTSGSGKIRINGKTGQVTVKKGLKKGKTYDVKVKVTAAGNDNYKKSATKTVTFKVRIK